MLSPVLGWKEALCLAVTGCTHDRASRFVEQKRQHAVEPFPRYLHDKIVKSDLLLLWWCGGPLFFHFFFMENSRENSSITGVTGDLGFSELLILSKIHIFIFRHIIKVLKVPNHLCHPCWEKSRNFLTFRVNDE